jgi:hypothetical protein
MVLMARRKKGKVEEEEDTRPRFTTYKFSANGSPDSNLFESVLVGGRPAFLLCNHLTNKIEANLEIDDDFRILCPPQPGEYSYPPYAFKDEIDILNTFKAAKGETLDTLFNKCNYIVAKFNDQDSYKLESIASDVVWSYFQDRFATTRYEVLTGGVGSGKSALAATFGAIGYRPVNTTNPTAAVIYRLLGNIEPG